MPALGLFAHDWQNESVTYVIGSRVRRVCPWNGISWSWTMWCNPMNLTFAHFGSVGCTADYWAYVLELAADFIVFFLGFWAKNKWEFMCGNFLCQKVSWSIFLWRSLSKNWNRTHLLHCTFARDVVPHFSSFAQMTMNKDAEWMHCVSVCWPIRCLSVNHLASTAFQHRPRHASSLPT